MSAPFTGPYDCDAHRSINLSQRQIANTKTISEILALLFCKVDGLGAALVPGEDGNRHAVRLHAHRTARWVAPATCCTAKITVRTSAR